MTAIGQPLARTESVEKVTGRARYAVEQSSSTIGAGRVYCCYVPAAIAVGTVESVDVDTALSQDGVLAVLWHGNAEKLAEVPDGELAVLQSNAVSYRDQIVAAVVAESLEIAQEAADQLVVNYGPHHSPDNDFRVDHPSMYAPEQVNAGFPTDVVVGDPDSAFDAAAHQVDAWYTTAALHNSPMEPHASTAVWAEGKLTVWDSTQAPSGVQSDLATLFDIDTAAVRVVSENVGGGFGAKGSTRPNVVLAAMAARAVGRPVELALPRQALFALVGYRTPTIQRYKLGADKDGRLTSISHDAFSQTSTVFEFAEQTAEVTRHIYAADNRRTTHRLATLDVPTPRWMRAPGEAPGMFAMESAMDELAYATGIDPIELRILNEPSVDPADGSEFSSRGLVECLRTGAEKFGWADRNPEPGSRTEGRLRIGTGVSAGSYPILISPSLAKARADQDGKYTVSVAASDIGTGARTALRQIAADALGVSADAVTLTLGDSSLPKAPGAGGSSGTSSWGWAVTKACTELRKKVDAGETDAEVTADTTDDVEGLPEKSRYAYAAQFAEVSVDMDTGEVRARRMLGVFGVGRIINPRLARSQLIGGMLFGLGMALMEEGVTDGEFGGFVNHDLAEYHVVSCADVPDIEATWIDEVDDFVSPTGGKGIGEIGNVGSTAAIANAVFHATGTRVRSLPIRLDRIL